MPIFRPGKPRFRLYRTSNYASPTGTFIVPWQAAEFDDVGGWDGAGAYTADRGGLWIVGATIRRSAVGTAATSAVRVRVNGVNKAETQMISTTASTTNTCVGLVELVAGDVLECAPAIASVGGGTVEAINSVFWGTRVGPIAYT